MKITIPPGISFADLRLSRDADGAVSFDVAVIERVCEASGLDRAVFMRTHEDNVAELLTSWYGAHIAVGGERDPVADDLIAEVRFENEHGSLSHKPGRA